MERAQSGRSGMANIQGTTDPCHPLLVGLSHVGCGVIGVAGSHHKAGRPEARASALRARM